MFKRSRIKIMALVMVILLGVLGGTLGIIYFTTYREVNSQNREMLEMYASMYASNGNPTEDEMTEEEILEEEIADEGILDEPSLDAELPGEVSGEPEAEDTFPDALEELGDPDSTRRYITSTFYSVTFSADGSVREIINDTMPLLDEEDLTALAMTLWESGKTFGTENDVVFLVTENEDYILVTMMDNTVLGESIDALIHYTLLFGGIFIAAAFLLSFFLSGWIIRPLEAGYQKQQRFISDAGHELKTPISTISANAELLSREIGENAWLANIQYENERMSILVRQLLDLARLERKGAALEEIDLSHVVLAGILPFEGVAFERGISLDYDIEEQVRLRADASQIGELVSILVDNAITHCSPEGTVQIRLAKSKGGAILTVSNPGTEIPEDQRDRIFEPFYRADESRSSAGTHYGLGLSIAKSVVEAHHGKIAVRCQEGITTFEVQL